MFAFWPSYVAAMSFILLSERGASCPVTVNGAAPPGYCFPVTDLSPGVNSTVAFSLFRICAG